MRYLAMMIESIRQGQFPCLFHLATGAYCPGCGGTRAMAALLHGDLAASVRFHPLVPYLAAAVPALLLYWLYGRRRGRKMRNAVWMTVLYAGVLILVVNFLVKNYYLLVRQVDLLAGSF